MPYFITIIFKVSLGQSPGWQKAHCSCDSPYIAVGKEITPKLIYIQIKFLLALCSKLEIKFYLPNMMRPCTQYFFSLSHHGVKAFSASELPKTPDNNASAMAAISNLPIFESIYVLILTESCYILITYFAQWESKAMMSDVASS